MFGIPAAVSRIVLRAEAEPGRGAGGWRVVRGFVPAALTNGWLRQQGVVSLQEAWTDYPFPGDAARVDE
jgi:hypothetical protein